MHANTPDNLRMLTLRLVQSTAECNMAEFNTLPAEIIDGKNQRQAAARSELLTYLLTYHPNVIFEFRGWIICASRGVDAAPKFTFRRPYKIEEGLTEPCPPTEPPASESGQRPNQSAI